jgi:hypothetical protein
MISLVAERRTRIEPHVPISTCITSAIGMASGAAMDNLLGRADFAERVILKIEPHIRLFVQDVVDANTDLIEKTVTRSKPMSRAQW